MVMIWYVQREKILKQFSFGIALNNDIYSRGGEINDSILNIDNNETRMIATIIVVAGVKNIF